MALPSTGPISFSDLRTEIGSSGPISLGDDRIVDLVGLYSFAYVDLLNARGKTYNFTYTLSSSTVNVNFPTLQAINAGWPGTGNLTLIIPAGVVTGTQIVFDNPWGNIEIINNGFIMGNGGYGGDGGFGTLLFNPNASVSYTYGGPGGTASPGLNIAQPSTNRIQRSVILINNGTIAGGGGGGGGGCVAGWGYATDADVAGGGGGGGGQGNNIALVNGRGGVGRPSTVNTSGGGSGNAYTGGNGSAGTTNAPGAGGAGASDRFGKHTGDGGAGGNLGANGSAGGNNTAGWGYFGQGGQSGAGIIGYNNLTVITFGSVLGALR